MRNSSGTYSLPAGNPVVTGQIISSTVQNNTMNDVATALTQSIASTGVTTPTANLPMGGFRHTGVGNATTQLCYGSVTDVQNGNLVSLSAVAGTNALTATAPFTPAAYATGQCWKFAAAATNTTAVTIDINTLGPKSILKFGATPLAGGDLAIGGIYEIVYDGTQFQLLNARQGAGNVGALVVNARSANTAFNINDLGSANQFTSTFTQAFDPAATLGAGWYVTVQNIGTGVVTFDANGTETFNTDSGPLTAINIYPGEGYTIMSNGTGFDLFGRATEIQVQAPVVVSGALATVEQGFIDTEFSSIRIVFSGVTVGGTSLAMKVKKGGVYVGGSTYSTSISYANGTAALNLTGQAVAAISGVNSSASQENSGWVTIVRPSDATGNGAIISECSAPETGAQGLRSIGASFETTTSAIQGVRFSDFSGAALTTGRFSAYGIRG